MSPATAGGLVARFLSRRIDEGWMTGACFWIEGHAVAPIRGALGRTAADPGGTPVADGTPFDLASLTKPLCTALLLVQFEQDGELDLAAPAAEWLPELRGTPYSAATILELATHRARLPGWRPLYLRARDAPAYVGAIVAEPPAVPRGVTLYSDLGYILLGALLERVGGAGLDRLFDDRIARAAGLSQLGFPTAARRFDDAAATESGNGYERALAGEAGRDHAWRREIPCGEVHDGNAHALGGIAGHAGLFGPVEDVAVLGREMLVSRRLRLGARARARLQQSTAGAAGRTVGWVQAGHSRATRGILHDRAPGHTGFTGTSLWLDPQRQGLFALLTNRVHPAVSSRDFQWLRRGFHRAASAELRGATGRPARRGAGT